MLSHRSRTVLKAALRILGGIAVLALVVWYAEPAALFDKLRSADARFVCLAVVSAITANIVAAARWATIAKGLGMTAPKFRLTLMYARGITTGVLLPGATLSSDLLRSYQLHSLGNSLTTSAISVFLDRFSGLWTLCVLSLTASGVIAATGSLDVTPTIAIESLVAYMGLLGLIVVIPLLPLRFDWLAHIPLRFTKRLAELWQRLSRRLRSARPALARSAALSLLVQALSACTLWICGMAVGLSLPYAVMLAAAAPIFIMAVMPVGVAGFGTRELAAVVVLGFAQVPGELAAACALLYGLCAVVQGILFAPLFLLRP